MLQQNDGAHPLFCFFVLEAWLKSFKEYVPTDECFANRAVTGVGPAIPATLFPPGNEGREIQA